MSEMTRETRTHGIMAFFESSGDLLVAAKKTRDAGYTKFDAHSPFPIHGMDDAMGLKRSPLGWICGLSALILGSGLLALQWWTSAVDYKLVISGKPLFSFQAYVPVTFAGAVIGGAFAAVLGMMILNGLPRPFHPLFYSDSFEKFSDDGFLVSIEADDPKFDERETKAFLESIGGKNIEVVRG